MIFANDLQNPEGPLALPDGTWVIVEGSAGRGCVSYLSADGRTRREIRRTGWSEARDPCPGWRGVA
jgi:hypothetical protein